MTHPNIEQIHAHHARQRAMIGDTAEFEPFPTRTLAEACARDRDCVVITHLEQRPENRGQWTFAWESHASSAAHIACRLGEQTPLCEDHTSAGGDGLLPNPQLVEWTPMCGLCHVLFGHRVTPHEPHPGVAGGDAVAARRLLHPELEPPEDHFLRHNGTDFELHHGGHYTECSTCAPRALVCDGCRAELDEARVSSNA